MCFHVDTCFAEQIGDDSVLRVLGLHSGSLRARNQGRKHELVLSPSIRDSKMKCCLKSRGDPGGGGSVTGLRWLLSL